MTTWFNFRERKPANRQVHTQYPGMEKRKEHFVDIRDAVPGVSHLTLGDPAFATRPWVLLRSAPPRPECLRECRLYFVLTLSFTSDLVFVCCLCPIRILTLVRQRWFGVSISFPTSASCARPLTCACFVLSVAFVSCQFVHTEMKAYRLYTVVPRLVEFIEQLTNCYVRLNRNRLKGSEGAESARAGEKERQERVKKA